MHILYINFISIVSVINRNSPSFENFIYVCYQWSVFHHLLSTSISKVINPESWSKTVSSWWLIFTKLVSPRKSHWLKIDASESKLMWFFNMMEKAKYTVSRFLKRLCDVCTINSDTSQYQHMPQKCTSVIINMSSSFSNIYERTLLLFIKDVYITTYSAYL